MHVGAIRLFVNDFLLFLKKPAQKPDEASPSISSSTRFWLAFLADFSITIFISSPLIYLVDKFLLRLRIEESVFTVDNLFVLIIMLIIIAPVLEELFFRYPLRFIKPRYLKLAVYISSITFGLIHSTNYENTQPLFYILLPVILSSQSLGGFILAYLRLREGLLWSMFAHALHNATILILSTILLHDRVVLSETGDHYTLTVTEYSFREGPPATHVYRNGELIDSIVWKQADLQSLVDSLSSTPLQADQMLVDVELETTQPISADSVLTLLRKEFRIYP